MAGKDAEQPSIEYQRTEDFTEAYANNVFLEQSAWDLKLVFGQLDQTGGRITVQQHTAVTLPWAQAKIFSYWLRGFVTVYEMTNGKIPILPSTIPPELPPPTEELKKSEPHAEEIYAVFNKLRNKLVAGL